ncbi:MAG: transcriptional repressor LexA [Acidobacteriota bacterium]
MRNITPKQKKLLDFIVDFQRARGVMPSQEEMARHFGFKSLGTIQNYLRRLEKNGYIKMVWNRKRAIQVVGSEPYEVPFVGYVAAGQPIEAIEQFETFEVPPPMVRAGENFVLKVKGDSMVEEGIMDGDYIVVRKQATAEDGQTVVALIRQQEATVKKLYRRRDGRIELRPANAAMAPIVVDAADLAIQGILVGVVRYVR